MKLKFANSLKCQLLLFVILGIVPASIIGIFIASSIAKQSLETKTEELLELKTTLIKDNIDKWNEINIGVLRSLSSMPAIVSMDAEKQKPILRNITDNYKHLYRAMTIDLEGWNIARNDSTLRNFRGDREYFKRAIAGQDISYQSLRGRTTKKLSVCMGRSIVNEKIQLVGVVAICSYLQQITEELGQLKFGKTGYAMLVDSKGTVLGHPNPAYQVSDELHNLSKFPPVANLLANGPSDFNFEYEGKNWVSKSTRLKNGWGAIVVMSTSEFLADERRFEEVMIAIGILSTVGLALFTWVLAHQIIGPISSLTETAVAISRGQYNRSVKIERFDELGILANAFNQMAKKVGIRQQYLEAEIQKRTGSIQLDRQRAILAQKKAEKADRAKEEFLFKLSHELKTPLNAIIGYSSFLSQDFPNDARIRSMLQSGRHLLLTIEDIFDFNKFQKGTIALECEPINLNSLCVDVIDIVKVSTQPKIKIYTECCSLELPIVLADRTRLIRVLINLLNNAIKFTPSGSVTLRLNLLSENFENIKIKFSVIDTGIGIAPENFRKIFEAFHQVTSNSGTGLGLNISQQIIQAMGSQIQVKSQVNKGSIFYFQLILKKAKQSTHLSIKEPEQLPPIQHLSKTKKILLVEDLQSNRELIKFILVPLGFEIVEAENAKHAIEIAKNRDDLDLILTDYFMPEQCGLTMIYQLRRMNKYARIPIIVTSSTDAMLMAKKVVEHNANDFLAKPFTPEELLHILEKHIDLEWLSSSSNSLKVFKEKLVANESNLFP